MRPFDPTPVSIASVMMSSSTSPPIPLRQPPQGRARVRLYAPLAMRLIAGCSRFLTDRPGSAQSLGGTGNDRQTEPRRTGLGIDALSNVLKAVRLTGAIFFDV